MNNTGGIEWVARTVHRSGRVTTVEQAIGRDRLAVDAAAEDRQRAIRKAGRTVVDTWESTTMNGDGTEFRATIMYTGEEVA